MTLNEVEQAIRNLITNQPMVTSGPSGEVVSSILSIINSYRNVRLLVQNHPSQDSFKFNATNIFQRAENDLASSICQTLQERGINLMMYMPNNQFGMNQNSGYMYQGLGNNIAPNMSSGVLGGQVVYNNQPMQQSYPSNGVQYNQPMQQPPFPQPQFRPNGMPPRLNMMGQNAMGQNLYPKTPAPTKPIMVSEMEGPPRPTPKRPDYKIPQPVAQPTKTPLKKSKHADKSKPEIVMQQEAPAKVVSEPQPQPVVEPVKEVVQEQPVVQEAPEKNTVKATGRNYLLELLKK